MTESARSPLDVDLPTIAGATVTDDNSARLRRGDWVHVFGQVTAERAHPDDVTVEMFSHNAQFEVNVRRDRVVRIDPPAGIALRCTRLWGSGLADELLRCRLHDGHSGSHEATACDKTGFEWDEAQTVGYMEER